MEDQIDRKTNELVSKVAAVLNLMTLPSLSTNWKNLAPVIELIQCVITKKNVQDQLSIIDEKISQIKSELNPSNIEEILVLNIIPMFADFIRLMLPNADGTNDSRGNPCSPNEDVTKLKGEMARLSAELETVKQSISSLSHREKGRREEEHAIEESEDSFSRVDRRRAVRGKKREEEPLSKKAKIRMDNSIPFEGVNSLGQISSRAIDEFDGNISTPLPPFSPFSASVEVPLSPHSHCSSITFDSDRSVHWTYDDIEADTDLEGYDIDVPYEFTRSCGLQEMRPPRNSTEESLHSTNLLWYKGTGTRVECPFGCEEPLPFHLLWDHCRMHHYLDGNLLLRCHSCERDLRENFLYHVNKGFHNFGCRAIEWRVEYESEKMEESEEEALLRNNLQFNLSICPYASCSIQSHTEVGPFGHMMNCCAAPSQLHAATASYKCSKCGWKMRNVREAMEHYVKKCQRASIVWFFESETEEWEMKPEKSREWKEMEEERRKMMEEDEDMKEMDEIWERKLRMDRSVAALRSKLFKCPHCPFKSSSQKGPIGHLSKCSSAHSGRCTNRKGCFTLECADCGMKTKKLDEMIDHHEQTDHLSIGWHFSCRDASPSV